MSFKRYAFFSLVSFVLNYVNKYSKCLAIITDSGYIGKAWYVKEDRSISIPCFPGEDDRGLNLKYKGGIFDWTYAIKNGPVLDLKKTLYGNGTMVMNNVTRYESATLKCSVEKMDGTNKKEFTHSVIVYSTAQFFLIYPFLYSVSNCDVRANEKQEDLIGRLCYNWGNDREACPFTSRMECYLMVEKEGIDNRRLRIHVEQRMDKNFVIPDCDAKCIKKAVFGHFMDKGEKVAKEVIEAEIAGSSNSKFAGFSFDREELLHQSISIRCPNGHQIYQQVLCVPCFPGSSVMHNDRFSYKSSPDDCELCDFGFYQELFAMEICYKCSRFGITTKRGATSRGECTERRATSLDIYIAAGAILLVGFSLSTLCATKFGIELMREKNVKRLEAVGLDVKEGQLSPVETSRTFEFPQSNPNNINSLNEKCQEFLDGIESPSSHSGFSSDINLSNSSCLLEGLQDSDLDSHSDDCLISRSYISNR